MTPDEELRRIEICNRNWLNREKKKPQKWVPPSYDLKKAFEKREKKRGSDLF